MAMLSRKSLIHGRHRFAAFDVRFRLRFALCARFECICGVLAYAPRAYREMAAMKRISSSGIGASSVIDSVSIRIRNRFAADSRLIRVSHVSIAHVVD
jgi:hypothetical protein